MRVPIRTSHGGNRVKEDPLKLRAVLAVAAVISQAEPSVPKVATVTLPAIPETALRMAAVLAL